MLVEFGKANLLEKARKQPDKVRMALDKLKTDGLMPTINAVYSKLEQPLALGYCNVGLVRDMEPGITEFSAGDRVASNGRHAEMVSVPVNLCARVPDCVSDDEAAFTVIGAISLQGIRLAQPSLGEAVVVIGLGLVGLLTVQLLRAHGCRVLGLDYDSSRLELARQFGAEVVNLSTGEDPLAIAHTFSRGRGVDAVLITASTKSSHPVHQAAQMCRKRGRIVLVGVTGLELSRADFYEKELTFQVSCSYGPGRYDISYEQKGIDYPIAFVRWTEQRNFEAVLDMLATGRLDVKSLISHRFSIEEAEKAYELVSGTEPSLGILLNYAPAEESADTHLRRATIKLANPATSVGKVTVAFAGSGNYATAVLIPAFRDAGVRLRTVASSGGISGMHAGRKFAFEQTTTDTDSVFSDSAVNAVVIATRHESHARLVCQGLRARKHVFVEKPLCLTLDELQQIQAAYSLLLTAHSPPILMVGFNRRFAPHVRKIKSLLSTVKEPKVMVMTVNAGAISSDHWTQNPVIGGGRIIGEACHFIDLLRFLVDAPIRGHQSISIGRSSATNVAEDKASITLQFEDGSIGTILYVANGHKSFPKERLEVFTGGRILQLDNFRKLRSYGWPGCNDVGLWQQNKGQKECVAAFVRAVSQGEGAPIPFEQLLEVSRVTIEIAERLRRETKCTCL